MRRNKFVFVFLVIVFTGFITSLSFAQPPIDRGIKPEPRVTVPDDPQIREFSVNPTSVVQGGSVTFRWRVESGMAGAGSAITRVRITVGAIELHSSSSASGEARVSLPAAVTPRAASLTVLTATNQIGRTSQRTLNMEIYSTVPEIVEFTVSPHVVIAGSTLDFTWSVVPRAGEDQIVSIKIDPGVLNRIGTIRDPIDARGRHTIRISPDAGYETKRYTLTVTNLRGMTANRTSPYVDIKPMPRLDLMILEPPTVAFTFPRWAATTSPAIRFTFKVYNTGPQDASNVEWQAWLLRTDEIRSGGPGQLIKAGTIRTLRGREQTTVRSDTDYGGLSHGEGYLLKIKIDPRNVINETNETNNKEELAFVAHW
jgi:hypothetical protein